MFCEYLQVVAQVYKFLIVLVPREVDYRNAIVKLIAERKDPVVDDSDVRERLLENPQVLDIEAVMLDARVPVKASLDQFVARVNNVEDRIRVCLFRSRENHDLKELISHGQAVQQVRSEIDTSFACLILPELDSHNLVSIFHLTVVHTVDQGFVKVKN